MKLDGIQATLEELRIEMRARANGLPPHAPAGIYRTDAPLTDLERLAAIVADLARAVRDQTPVP